jgi:hypothetical protein
MNTGMLLQVGKSSEELQTALLAAVERLSIV